jgi:hypothetical protein
MSMWRIGSMVLVILVVVARPAPAEQQKISTGCEKIVAVLDESGGSLSADEIAKKTGTDVETVRSCTDQWRASKKDPSGPASAKTQPMPPGCAKVVAVLDQGGGGLSADEVAKKSSTDVETVRNCTDLWRKTKQN